MLDLKGIFGGSLKMSSENANNSEGGRRQSPKILRVSWRGNLLFGRSPEYCEKKAPKAMRAMRGHTLEAVPFQP